MFTFGLRAVSVARCIVESCSIYLGRVAYIYLSPMVCIWVAWRVFGPCDVDYFWSRRDVLGRVVLCILFEACIFGTRHMVCVWVT